MEVRALNLRIDKKSLAHHTNEFCGNKQFERTSFVKPMITAQMDYQRATPVAIERVSRQ